MKLKAQDLGATAQAKTVAIEVLSRSRNRPNFGNAGEVENLLGQAKARYQTRQALLPIDERNFDVVFDSQDFDPDYDRGAHASTNLQKLFEDVVGCEDIVRRLGEYQQVAAALKARNIDARGEVPMNFVFKGPPGMCGNMWKCENTMSLVWLPRYWQDDHCSKDGAGLFRHGISVLF